LTSRWIALIIIEAAIAVNLFTKLTKLSIIMEVTAWTEAIRIGKWIDRKSFFIIKGDSFTDFATTTRTIGIFWVMLNFRRKTGITVRGMSAIEKK
jgi:hypothetical protein